MTRIIQLLCCAALLGVAIASSATCGVGLLSGTGTWCTAIPFMWLVGMPLAVASALLLGVPTFMLYQRLALRRWWQFLLGGALAAIPLWYHLAAPFASVRWDRSGLFDSLEYLGSGAAAGVAFWYLVIARRHREAP